jgi:hypothetical protein
MLFEKKLSSSEKERHYIQINKKSRKFFPMIDVVFKIKINNRLYETYIDSKDRIRLGSIIFNDAIIDQPNSYISIEKNGDVYFLYNIVIGDSIPKPVF